jgi:predicted ATPase
MKTFEFMVENLGPIKRAAFSSSHLNVLCGKNNSGKSFLIHAVYCILQRLGGYVTPTPKQELIDKLASEGKAEFNAMEYLGDLNEKIKSEMPKIVSALPKMMSKSESAFEGCKISLNINEDYSFSFVKKTPILFKFQVSKTFKFIFEKKANSDDCRVIIENSAEEFPSNEEIKFVLHFALRRFVGVLFPAPVLLTAERAGVVSFATDLMSYAMSKKKEQSPVEGGIAAVELSDHYPSAIIQELILQNDMRQVREDAPFLMADYPNATKFFNWFKEHVMDGDVVAREGKLYYLQTSNQINMPFSDASSSVKALVSLNFFVHYMMQPGTILMIDEPELNLHPERQRMLMRAFARMANDFGVGIVLSTHSVTMVRELNTLLTLNSAIANNPEIRSQYGYEESELLKEEDVSCGIVENGTIWQDPKGVSHGFSVRSFDDTNDSISSIQSDIVKSW